MDFIEQLPSSSSFTAILVIVDWLSKQSIFIPTHNTITSLELTKLFLLHVFSKHGVPVSQPSNSGPGNSNSGHITALQLHPGRSQAFPVPDLHPRCNPWSKPLSDLFFTAPLHLPFLDPVTFLGPCLPFV